MYLIKGKGLITRSSTLRMRNKFWRNGIKPQARTITTQECDFFREKGYVHLPGILSKEECESLKSRVQRILDDFDPSSHRSVFKTTDHDSSRDHYFMTSSDKIRCFFEEHAFDEDGETLKVPKNESVNKIGHAIHRDPIFSRISAKPETVSILQALQYRRPSIVQSMYIFKQPSIGGEVMPHQDGTFLRTTPHSVIGLWFALEDATLENGCLWGLPGSHKEYPISQYLVRNEKGTGVSLIPEEPAKPYNLDNKVPIEAKAGDLILLNHAFVHFSEANTSPLSRQAYTLHVIETDGAEYAAENWLHYPNNEPFQPVYPQHQL